VQKKQNDADLKSKAPSVNSYADHFSSSDFRGLREWTFSFRAIASNYLLCRATQITTLW